MTVRCVVTGHDENGKAVFDAETPFDLQERRPGMAMSVAWTTLSHPVDNTDAEDGPSRPPPVALANGDVFLVLSIAPGQQIPMHRTQTLDYGIVLKGEVDWELDSGQVKRLTQGDLIVQRGAAHAWVNRGQTPVEIAFVQIAAKPGPSPR